MEREHNCKLIAQIYLDQSISLRDHYGQNVDLPVLELAKFLYQLDSDGKPGDFGSDDDPEEQLREPATLELLTATEQALSEAQFNRLEILKAFALIQKYVVTTDMTSDELKAFLVLNQWLATLPAEPR